jgi:hypothetical protein
MRQMLATNNRGSKKGESPRGMPRLITRVSGHDIRIAAILSDAARISSADDHRPMKPELSLPRRP